MLYIFHVRVDSLRRYLSYEIAYTYQFLWGIGIFELEPIHQKHRLLKKIDQLRLYSNGIILMELTLPEISLSTKKVGSKNSCHLSIEPRKIINFDEIRHLFWDDQRKNFADDLSVTTVLGLIMPAT